MDKNGVPVCLLGGVPVSARVEALEDHVTLLHQGTIQTLHVDTQGINMFFTSP